MSHPDPRAFLPFRTVREANICRGHWPGIDFFHQWLNAPPSTPPQAAKQLPPATTGRMIREAMCSSGMTRLSRVRGGCVAAPGTTTRTSCVRRTATSSRPRRGQQRGFPRCQRPRAVRSTVDDVGRSGIAGTETAENYPLTFCSFTLCKEAREAAEFLCVASASSRWDFRHWQDANATVLRRDGFFSERNSLRHA